MIMKRGTLILGGQARLPKELSSSEVFQVIAEVEIETGRVVDVEFSPCPALIAGLLKQLMIGMSLPDEGNDVLNQIEQRLFYKGKKAVITSIKDLVRECKEYHYRISKGIRPSSEI